MKTTTAITRRQNETCNDIFKMVEFASGVSPKEFRSSSRKREIVEARWVAMYCIDECTTMTLAQTGSLFDVDHATVINALNKVEGQRAKDYELNRLIRAICEKCGPHAQVSNDFEYIKELGEILVRQARELERASELLRMLRK